MGATINKQEIVTRALALAVAERNSFLDTACGGDKKLRDELARLITDSQLQRASSPPVSGSSIRTQLRTTRIRGKLRQALRQNYVIQERIGSGGMGDLYLASHKTLGGKWAIKVLAEDLAKDPKVVDRFVNEAKIEANLKHPNIVKVFHIGHSGGFHYFVMDYIDGEDLSERMEASRRLPEAEAASIAYQICRALECAHDNNIFHRDLKPSNVRIDRYGTVVVLDFGIARARDVAVKMTGIGERMGTPLYMSPEQIKGGAIDARSDMYSLGVLLYEMLTGVNPFMADTSHGVYGKHLYYAPQPLVELNSHIKPALSRIVMALLEKDPDKRIQTAKELGALLRPFRESTEITPSHPSPKPATVKIRHGDERMTHVVVRVPETVIARQLSPEETAVLQLTDGNRTIGEMLEISELDSDRFLIALETLKAEAALQTIAGHETYIKEPKAEGVTAEAPSSRTVRPMLFHRRWVYVALSLVVLVAAGLAFLYFRNSRTAVVSPADVLIQVDASPYARVRILGQEGKVVYEEITPFATSLPKGRYKLEFEYKGRRVTRDVEISGKALAPMRADFFEPRDVDKVLDMYLPNQ